MFKKLESWLTPEFHSEAAKQEPVETLLIRSYVTDRHIGTVKDSSITWPDDARTPMPTSAWRIRADTDQGFKFLRAISNGAFAEMDRNNEDGTPTRVLVQGGNLIGLAKPEHTPS